MAWKNEVEDARSIFHNTRLQKLQGHYKNYEKYTKHVEYNSDDGILVVDNNSPNESFKIISEEFSDDNKV